MSPRLLRTIGRTVLSAGLVLVLSTPAAADTLFTVTDLGAMSDTFLSSPQTGDINTQRRLLLDSAGNVTTGAFGFPAPYAGALPDALTQGRLGGQAVVLSQDGGNVAGWGFNQATSWTAFAVIGGKATVINPLPGDVFDQALGVNQAGQVVGFSGYSGRPFLYSPENGVSAIGTPSGHGAAYAVNDAGLIVGAVGNPSFQTPHAFLSSNGAPAVDLNSLIAPGSGWTLTTAMAINDAGQIATFGTDAVGQSHALLLTPVHAIDPAQIADLGNAGPSSGPPNVPEPSTLAVFLGFGAVLAVRKRLKARRAGGRPGRNSSAEGIDVRTRTTGRLLAALTGLALLLPTVSRGDASPPSYTLSDIGVIPQSAVSPPYQPRINDVGSIEFQAPADLSPLVGNGVQAGAPNAYVRLNGVQQWLGPSDRFGGTVANAGTPDLLVGAVSLAGASSPHYPAVYTPQTGWTLLNGIAANPGQANAVNAQGQVVGEALPTAGPNPVSPHAFLSQGGTTYDLNTLIPASSDLVLLTATGINNLGQIAGVAESRSDPSNFQVFELSPASLPPPTQTPEPGTLAVFGLTVLALAARRRARP